MWAAIGRTEYVFEAKQIWVSLSNKARSTYDRIIESLKEARKDAANTKWMGAKALGIIFAAPRIAPSEREKSAEFLSAFQKTLRTIDYDFMAYAFPPNANVISTMGYLYPGVAMLARVPKRNSSS